MIGKMIYAGNAKIHKSVWSKRGDRQYFSGDPFYTVIGERGDSFCVRHHSLNEGITGWFKKDDVSIVEDSSSATSRINSATSRITSSDLAVKRDILDMIEIISAHINLSEDEANRFERKLNHAKEVLEGQEYRENYLWNRK